MTTVSSLSSPLSKEETVSAIRKMHRFSVSEDRPQVCKENEFWRCFFRAMVDFTLARPSTLLYFCYRERGLQTLSYQPASRFSQLCFYCKLQKTVKMVQSWFDNFYAKKFWKKTVLKINLYHVCLFSNERKHCKTL